MAGGGALRSKHAPARFRTYITAHENHMAKLRETQFVGADNLEIIAWPSRLVMIGDIGCLGDITITVEKYLRVLATDTSPADVLAGDHDVEVQTFLYSYRAGVRGHGTIIRVDNNHPWKGHADEHHKHHCDWRSDDDIGRVEWLGEDRWQTLGEFVREVAVWYDAHRDELPNPDSYATPLARVPQILWNPLAHE